MTEDVPSPALDFTLNSITSERDHVSLRIDPGMPSAGIAGAKMTLSYTTGMLLSRQGNADGSSAALSLDALLRINQVWYAEIGKIGPGQRIEKGRQRARLLINRGADVHMDDAIDRSSIAEFGLRGSHVSIRF